MKIIKHFIWKTVLIFGISMLFAAAGFSQNAKDCKPQILRVIETMRVDEVFSLGTLYLSCVETPEANRQNKVFDAYEGPKFVSNLKDSSGKLVNSFVWYGDKYRLRTRMTRYEIVGGREALKKLSAGDYKLEFAIDGKVFYTLPFSIKTRKSSDPYNPGTVYMTDGFWREGGSISASTKAESLTLYNRFRDTDERAETKFRRVPFSARIVRNSDKKTVAESSTSVLRLNNNWEASEIRFRQPDDSPKNAKHFLEEILSKNGKYTIELELDEKPYLTYEFVVKDGKINGKEIGEKFTNVVLKGNDNEK